jgi:polyisoprenoid-binding protein YceI
LAAFLLATSGTALADWELDSTASTINFVSIKNNSVAEVHSFTSLVGFVGAAGNAQLTVNLESVETLIDVRNERMRELLFETVKFPVATVSADVDPGVLAMAAEGGVVTVELPITLSLHGQEKTLNAALVIVGEGEHNLQVLSASPLLLDAADFGLAEGVAALQKVAGLQAISTAVPVTLQLQFVKVP